jgi:hypothetical protein
MVGVRYIARTSLIAGHVAGVTYFLPIEFTECRRSRDVDKDVRRTLSGRTETRYHRTDTIYLLQFRPTRGAQLDQLREMLDSVQTGEAFTVWPYDDGPALELERMDDSHEFTPYMRTDSRHTDWMQASAITTREVS